MIRTGGTFSSDALPLFLIGESATLSDVSQSATTMFVVPSENDLELCHQLGKSHHLLYDSGAYDLLHRHQKAMSDGDVKDIENPHKVKGYDDQLAHYMEVVSKCNLWGYFEFDIGTQHARTLARESLQQQGVFPIPIFHAQYDKWDYYRFLVETYDRVAIADLGDFDNNARTDFLSEAFSIHKDKTWVHVTGVGVIAEWHQFDVCSIDTGEWQQTGKFNIWTHLEIYNTIGSAAKTKTNSDILKFKAKQYHILGKNFKNIKLGAKF